MFESNYQDIRSLLNSLNVKCTFFTDNEKKQFQTPATETENMHRNLNVLYVKELGKYQPLSVKNVE